MIITVDTKNDSTEDIRKAISLLQNLIGEEYSNSSTPVQPTPQVQDTTSLFGMFDNSSQSSTPVLQSSEKKPDEEDEDLTDIPQIIPY